MFAAVESRRGALLNGHRVIQSRQNVSSSLIGTTIIKTIALAVISSWLSQSEPVDALASSNSSPPPINRNSSKPIWQRPGCYQVGHTRTISIPGCVKFNLSTNACRGYCLSFSIPAAEDIGPPASSIELNGEGFHEPSENLANDFVAGERLMKRYEIARRRKRAASHHSLVWPEGYPFASGSSHQRRNSLASMVSAGANSPLFGNTGEKRDVISVAQCCNMMETEDVTVNLRCGFNETRRLVFKSAKTCECFFCKQV